MIEEPDDDWAAWEKGERVFFEQLLDLFAWLLAVTNDQVSSKDRLKWPLLDLWRYEETQALAQSGPIFFDLARNQLAVDFGDEPQRFAQDDQYTVLISQFLLLDRPTNGQGMADGRAEMKPLVGLMLRIHRPLNFWDLPLRRTQGEDGSAELLHSDYAFCVALSEKLSVHRRLAELPFEAVPSPEALRRLLTQP